MESVQIVTAPAVRATKSTRGMLSPEQLLRVLQQERARSDRTGRRFSLVVFEAQAAPETVRRRVTEHLSRQVRLTDAIGWYNSHHACAVLTETNPDGAGVFADRVCATLADEGVRVKPAVQVYPARRPRTPDFMEEDEDGDGAPPSRTPPDPWAQRRGGGVAAVAEAVEVSFAQPLPRWKRAIDVLGASLALVMLSPLLAIAALAVRVDSAGRVIFKQERAGLGGRPFGMYKFRTMIEGAERQQDILRPLNEQDGPAFKLTRDPRITRVGWWLRKTSIDELPQLWNILKGEMTLVGPRPLPCRESDACQQWHRARLDVTPGLTCIWQVNGRCTTNFDRWVRMDLDYAQRRTLWMDLKLIARTVPAVLLQKGAK